MSATLLLTLAASSLLAGGLAEALADASRRVGPAVAWTRARLRGPEPRDRRLGRLLPVTTVGGAVLLVVGAPLPAAIVAGAPVAWRTWGGTRRARRRRAVALGAPLVGRAIADGLDAGFGVRRAITEAARAAAVGGPAGDELDAVAARLDAGDPLPAAVDGWRLRTDESAHATLVAALLLHGDASGELADVLREQAAALDRARRQAAEAESAVVQARAAARIVGGIPAVATVAAVVLAPDVARQVTATPLGALLVVAAVALQAMAFVAVRRLTARDGR